MLKVSKKVSDIQKKDILNSFKKGLNIKDISKEFKFSIPTIIRQLRSILGEEEYIRIKNLKSNDKFSNKENIKSSKINRKLDLNSENINVFDEQFFEIAPLDEFCDLDKQKEISSEPISNIEFPKLVYIIVSNKVELQTKQLKDYPDWQFLPSDDLERKTIEIFHDLKSAKRSCSKDQKVIKVPNTNVFKIVAPILISKGISRIISDDQLIAL